MCLGHISLSNSDHEVIKCNTIQLITIRIYKPLSIQGEYFRYLLCQKNIDRKEVFLPASVWRDHNMLVSGSLGPFKDAADASI